MPPATPQLGLINTIQSIVGVDIDCFASYPVVDGQGTNGGYCGLAVKPIAPNMLKNCAQHPGVRLPISGIGGIENWRDAVEHILLGASSVQICTAAMQFGFGIIRELLSGLEEYMVEKNFHTIYDSVGKALPNVRHWEDLNMKYQVKAHIHEGKYIGCQLCYTACEDGAHQAIRLQPGSRVPAIIEDNCVGCNICSLVCPVENCITVDRRDDGTQHQTWKERTAAGTIPTEFNDERAGGRHHWVPAPAALGKERHKTLPGTAWALGPL
ncbi:4Fe-4S dicluster-binding protein [Hymenobacter sp. PAMC 26628]|uniref:4Fe-4S dicluster-binding protein n=1 Tax=Hymenobacter sp. PAMC 26628 TaxID=1484118 RepID=UPI0007704FF7|nr:4Fe-4S dicluster-binding protein [Hymenobacter sp. PAMC 26628]AMJ65821.1 hypothetical protein AXW84_10560 [Hymenobacter sp. PAMC 26628]